MFASLLPLPPLLSSCPLLSSFHSSPLPCLPFSSSSLLMRLGFRKIIHLETQAALARCNFLLTKPRSGTSAKSSQKAGDLYWCREANRKIICVCTWKCQTWQEQSFSQAFWMITQRNRTEIYQKKIFFFFFYIIIYILDYWVIILVNQLLDLHFYAHFLKR